MKWCASIQAATSLLVLIAAKQVLISMVTSATTSEGVRDGGEVTGTLFSMGADDGDGWIDMVDGNGRGEDWQTQLKLAVKVR